MTARLLGLLVVLLAAGLLGWRWLEPSDTTARAPGRPVLAPEPAGGEPRAPAPPERIASATTPRQEDAAGSREAVDRPSASQVVVVATVVPVEGFAGSPEGWTVELQTWVEETGTVHAHAAATDAGGRAELRFDEAVHVDWLRCRPPDATGLAVAFVEVHLNLEPGDVLREVLEPGAGGTLHGRVVDARGAPLADVAVRACLDPGGEPVLTVRTDADGRFVLERLPPDDWSVEVAPLDWLQVDPPLNRPVEGRGRVALAAGARHDCGFLVAVARHAFEVAVSQPTGRPLPEVAVELEPLALHEPGLWTGAPEDPDVAAFLGRAAAVEAGIEWPYGTLSCSTNGTGTAHVFGVAGRWRLTVHPPVASDPLDATGVLVREVVVPCGDLALRFPADLLTLEGHVVDPDGAPLAGATARLDRGDGGFVRDSTGFTGRFLFERLPPGGSYELTLSRAGFVTGRWPVTPARIDEPFVLRPGAKLSLRLVDEQGAFAAGALVALQALFPEVPPRPAEQETCRRLETSVNRADDHGHVDFPDLPPGSARVAWLAPDDRRELATWVLPTGEERQTLVVDRGGLRPVVTTTHVLSVVEAGTGAALEDVQVLVATSGPFRMAHPLPDGRFEIQGRLVDHTLVVSAEGHRSRALSPTDCPAGSHEHRIALERGDEALRLRLVDRDGAALPTVDVHLEGVGGERCLHVLQQGDQRRIRAGAFVATDGEALLTPLLPGALRLEVSLGGHPLGQVELAPDEHAGAVTKPLPSTLAELRAALEAALAR